ncbi:MAG: xanthine dehydrogenase family protein molybdopterin-binding subunit [Clostridiales bacterium]|nr:xanthine dehydrogenase family protein molybdopterin-binding subunit [Clostridiales bacterium]
MEALAEQDHHRKEAWEKVTGKAVYTDDLPITSHYCARILTSPHGHARILSINTTDALAMEGVKAVVTGENSGIMCGTLIKDRPLLANSITRYAGEPVAMIVAVDEYTADHALQKVQVTYKPLPCVFRPGDSLKHGAPILHEKLGEYARVVDDVTPQAGTNIASHYPVRKGDMQVGWAASDVVVEESFYLPPSAHMPMEIHTARCHMNRDGTVEIISPTQAPFEVAKQNACSFRIPAGNIRSRVPLVGGAYGGKVTVAVEALAMLASQKVGGHPVRVILTREQEMTTMPCRMGLEARIKAGVTKDGMLQAMELTFWLDNGAYSDIGPYMAKSMAADCTGPYHVENLLCDAYAVYTNHTYATSYRGFAHESLTLCVERTMDKLAKTLKMDPLALRRLNALRPGHLSPTGVKCTFSNLGDVATCLDQIKPLSGWNPSLVTIDQNNVRAQGIACFWKSSVPPTDAVSGAVITFNEDGSLNLQTGVVEFGSGSKSLLAELLADRMRISIDQVHVIMDVDTRVTPKHFKSVASLSSYLAGRAVLRAAEDALMQLRQIGAEALCCWPEDIEVKDSKVYRRGDPDVYVHFKDLVYGFKAPAGASIGKQVIGRGGVMMKGLSSMDPVTGQGQISPAWTVGVQVVEVEVDLRDGTYHILRASTVMDVGNAVNPKGMGELVRGGMSMGLSMASRECFRYNPDGKPTTLSLRSYKVMHIGEEPEYRIAFVETPQEDAPYGTRSMSEHGIIGMAAALANALSAATGQSVNELPATPERLWILLKEAQT